MSPGKWLDEAALLAEIAEMAAIRDEISRRIERLRDALALVRESPAWLSHLRAETAAPAPDSGLVVHMSAADRDGRRHRKRGIADAAAQTLSAYGRPMHAREITEALRAKGLLQAAKNDNSAISSVVSAMQRDTTRFERAAGRNVWTLTEGGATAAPALGEPEDRG